MLNIESKDCKYNLNQSFKMNIDAYLKLLGDKTANANVLLADGRSVSTDEGLQLSTRTIIDRCSVKGAGRVFFIGNGGSAGIASHMAIDFWKNGEIPAMAFNDGALLTCISNDYSYQQVFEKPIDMFMSNKDVLIAISSSGTSKNILNGVSAAQETGAFVITLSGFSDDNSLRSMGDINFYIDSNAYGIVENGHQILLHYIIDEIVNAKYKR